MYPAAPKQEGGRPRHIGVKLVVERPGKKETCHVGGQDRGCNEARRYVSRHQDFLRAGEGLPEAKERLHKSGRRLASGLEPPRHYEEYKDGGMEKQERSAKRLAEKHLLTHKSPVHRPRKQKLPAKVECPPDVTLPIRLEEWDADGQLDLKHQPGKADAAMVTTSQQQDDSYTRQRQQETHFGPQTPAVYYRSHGPLSSLEQKYGEEEEEDSEAVVKAPEDEDGVEALGQDKKREDV